MKPQRLCLLGNTATLQRFDRGQDVTFFGQSLTGEKMVFACATNGRLEFDALCDKVIASLMMRPGG